MDPRNTTKAAAAASCALALMIAGCGSSSSDDPTSTAAPTASAASAGGEATIDVADNASLGSILTDADGNTVYLFEKDESDESYCSGKCASVWPPVTTDGEASVGDGADASLISTITREDGTKQVAYAGHPLYRYAGDESPGDTNGNELEQFGAEWYALTPDGSNAEGESADERGGSTDEDGDDY